MHRAGHPLLLFRLLPQPTPTAVGFHGIFGFSCLEKEMQGLLLVADGVDGEPLDINPLGAIPDRQRGVPAPSGQPRRQQVEQGLVVDLQVGNADSDHDIEEFCSCFEDLHKDKGFVSVHGQNL